MKGILLLFSICLSINRLHSQTLSADEQALFDIIMDYRRSLNLPLIPISRSLTLVAQTHAHDLNNNQPDQGVCNLHSWSNKGKWKACCYTDDHAQANGMWSKPGELTTYTGYGYEIAAWSSEAITAEEALDLWKSSPGHHSLIINSGPWLKKWQAIGIGICNGYALVWFGNEKE